MKIEQPGLTALMSICVAYVSLALVLAVGAAVGWDGQGAYLTLPFVCLMFIGTALSLLLALMHFRKSVWQALILLLANAPMLGFLAYANSQVKGHAAQSVNDAVGRIVSRVDALDNVSQSLYDVAGRYVAGINALGYRTTYAHDAVGNVVSVLNARGFVSTTIYDALNRTEAAEDALGHRTTYAYDAVGNNLEILDPCGAVITMTYTARDEMATIEDPLGFISTYAFGALGQRATRQFPSGDVTTYIYDPLQRLTTVAYMNGSFVTHAYDALGNRTTMVDSTGTTTYAYDALNRLEGKTDPGALVQAYAYDAASQRTTLIDPDGGVFTSVFDLDGNQTLVVDPDGKRTTFVFDSLGRPTTITDGSGVVEALSYDGESQLTTQIRDIAGVKTTIVDGYDPVGNRATRDTNGALTTWVYDAASHLTNQQGTNAFATFTMDATGNVTVKNQQGTNPVTMTYDLAGRLTTSIQGSAVTTFTFDDNGNQTVEESTGAVTHVYDLENRLTLVEDGVRLSTYTFDGDGLRRSVHQVGSVLTTMIWDGTDYLGETTSGTLSARVTNAIGRIVAEKRGGQRRYHQHDALGNTIALINDAGAVVGNFGFWPYGELTLPVIGQLPTPFLYCGQWGYYMDSLGRIYIRARTYRPVFTRWLTVDPMWPWESAYGYANAQPVLQMDFSGMNSCGAPRAPQCEPIPSYPFCPCLAHVRCLDNLSSVTFIMKLKPTPSSRVELGTLSVEIAYSIQYIGPDCPDDTVVRRSVYVSATSGLPGFQYDKSWCKKERGPIPPSRDISLNYRVIVTECSAPSTPGWVIGTERFAFPVVPYRVTPRSCGGVIRDNMYVHPDGRGAGTAGCVGISSESESRQVRSCFEYAAEHGCRFIPMKVIYT